MIENILSVLIAALNLKLKRNTLMSLSCSCDMDYYPEPGDTTWYEPADYAPLSTTRRKRCSSCHELIDIEALMSEVMRVKIPDSDIEIRIYGEDGEMPLASHYLCERCADLYFSLADVGYCMSYKDDMRKLIKEYAAQQEMRKHVKDSLQKIS